MVRVALFFLAMFVVAFFVWRGFRKPEDGNAPADFLTNISADLKVAMERISRILPYVLLAAAFVALYLFLTSANFTS
jgi:hypothetical protein